MDWIIIAPREFEHEGHFYTWCNTMNIVSDIVLRDLWDLLNQWGNLKAIELPDGTVRFVL